MTVTNMSVPNVLLTDFRSSDVERDWADFSAGGSVVELGFVTGNGTSPASRGYITNLGYDNWTFIINSASPEIDIKPGSDPNSINPFGMGLIPVAILDSDAVDVMDVDPDTLAFGPAGAGLAHADGPHFEDVNDDGFTDLVGHFAVKETGIAMGDEEACLTGEIDAEPFEACDDIRTVGHCGLGYELAFLLPPVMWLRRQWRRRIH